jgi:hypothetical protein
MLWVRFLIFAFVHFLVESEQGISRSGEPCNPLKNRLLHSLSKAFELRANMGVMTSVETRESNQKIMDTIIANCPANNASNVVSGSTFGLAGNVGDINIDQKAQVDSKCVMDFVQKQLLSNLNADKVNYGQALGISTSVLSTKSNEEIVNEVILSCGSGNTASNFWTNNKFFSQNLGAQASNFHLTQDASLKTSCLMQRYVDTQNKYESTRDTQQGISGAALGIGLASVAIIGVIGGIIYLKMRSGGGSAGGYMMAPPQPAYYAQPQPAWNYSPGYSPPPPPSYEPYMDRRVRFESSPPPAQHLTAQHAANSAKQIANAASVGNQIKSIRQ